MKLGCSFDLPGSYLKWYFEIIFFHYKDNQTAIYEMPLSVLTAHDYWKSIIDLIIIHREAQIAIMCYSKTPGLGLTP